MERPYKLDKYEDYKTAYVDIGNGFEPFSLPNELPFSITTVKQYLREGEVESSQPK